MNRIGLSVAPASAILIGTLLAAGLPLSRDARPSATPGRAGSAMPSLVSGFAYHSSRDGETEFSLEASELVRRRARLGPLALNPFAELVVTDLRVVLRSRQRDDADPGAPDRGSLPWSLQIPAELSSIGDVVDVGTITRVVIRGFETRFVADAGIPLALEAGEAELAPGVRRIDLRGGVTLRSADRELRARAVTWRLGSQSLQVRGPYELETLHGTRSGVDAKLALRPDEGVFELVRDGCGARCRASRVSAAYPSRLHATPAALR